jgi:hypothetical protein
VTSPEKILLEEQPLPTHRKALPDRLPRENVLLDVEDKVCERAEIVGPDLEFRSFAVQRKARLTRIPAIVEQDLKAGIRDEGPKPLASAMLRRAPETSATQGPRLPST